MKEINLAKISFTDLELFLAVAQYGSFTKAGEKMFMTQSWVSKRISLLENELHLLLFNRTKREVSLTPAGRVLKQRLEGVTDDIRNAISAAHVAQSGATGSLCLGFLDWDTFVFMDQIENFIDNNPQIAIEIFRQTFTELRNYMTSNRMDLAFTISYESDEMSTDEYNILHIHKVPLMAYMSKKHPLASEDSISLSDLRGEPILMVDDASSSGYSNYIRRLFLERDFRPDIAQYAHDGSALIGSILVNKGILLASEYFLENSWHGQIARPVVQNVNLYATAIWKKQNSNPVLINFLQCITDNS